MKQQEAEQYLYEEARLLDQRDYQRWRNLFSEDGVYWVPVNDVSRDPDLNCSIIYATGRQLDDRLERAGSSYFWADKPPIRSLHTISNVSVQSGQQGIVRVTANQVIYLFRENDQRRDVPLEILPAFSEYKLQPSANGWAMLLKKLSFLQADGYLPLLPAFV